MTRRETERGVARIRREMARRLRAGGVTIRLIADHLGVSQARVGAYVRGVNVPAGRLIGARNGGPKSARRRSYLPKVHKRVGPYLENARHET